MAGDDDRDRAAALGREVVQLEVLDVDAGGAERLRDARDHAGAIGHVRVDLHHLVGVALVRGLERAAPVAARLRDPAREEARVARLERGQHLVREPAVLADRGGERLAVVEEDVDPDARVGAGDARHVAEAAAARGERVVAVDAAGARLVDEQVRDHVGQVARQREQAVVRAGIDRDGLGAERGDEGVQVAVAPRVGVGRRREEPGRAVEEVGHRVLRAAHLAPADRMAADEAPAIAAGDRCDDGALGRADVGHRRLRRRHEHLGDRLRQLADRRAHADEVGVGDARVRSS